MSLEVKMRGCRFARTKSGREVRTALNTVNLCLLKTDSVNRLLEALPVY